MKLIVLFVSALATVALATTHVSKDTRGPNEQLAELLEKLKEQMLCGFPDLEIPPLVPFKADYIQYKLDRLLFSFLASVANFRVDGLDSYEVHEVTLNILSLKMTFDITFKEIHLVKGSYDTLITIAKLLKISGKGDLDFKLEGLRLKGAIKIGLSGENLELREMDVVMALAGVKSNISGLLVGKLTGKLANTMIETLIMYAVKNQGEFITDTIREIGIPRANEMLQGYTLKDFMDMITNPKEREPCVPQTFDNVFLQ